MAAKEGSKSESVAKPAKKAAAKTAKLAANKAAPAAKAKPAPKKPAAKKTAPAKTAAAKPAPAKAPETKPEPAKPAAPKAAPPPAPPSPAALVPPKPPSVPVQPDNKPLHPGIDALAVLEQADDEKERKEEARAARRPSGAPISAAEVTARAAKRDHPDSAAKKAKPKKLTPDVGARSPAKKAKPKIQERVTAAEAQLMVPAQVSGEDVAAILNAEHPNPFGFLGMHQDGQRGAVIVRAFLPQAKGARVIDNESGATVADLAMVHDEGLFVGEIPGRKRKFAYRLRLATISGEVEIDDPYRFGSVPSAADMRKLADGQQLEAHEFLGAHPTTHEGVRGTAFAVWAPHATHVSVVGDFNDWDGRRHGMRKRHEAGAWDIFMPGVSPGELYKFEIKGPDGANLEPKSDPYAFHAEGPTGTAAIVHDLKGYRWRDKDWMKDRAKANAPAAPMTFYQVHLGSWRRKPEEGDRMLTYRELADELVAHAKDMGFSHISLLPLNEHTWDGTQGFLPSNPYAPTSRHGSPQDLRHFVDQCHQAGIGVVMDWICDVISEEPHGMAWYDGGPLYENPNHLHTRDVDWGLPVYDYGKPQVKDYLLGNANYWLDKYHLDGLRIGSLAKMLYLDYGRSEGGWTPNVHGGNENLEAVALVQELNAMVAKRHPGTFTVAEDSSLRQRMTKSPDLGGMGFGYRWNTAWVWDTLRYLRRHPVHRKYYQFELTNPLIYAFDENFILPLSFDHVSIGQGSMLDKMPGDHWQKFATLRAWCAMMYGLPGKKLMFMGTEFAQDRQWNSDISLDWHLLDDPLHAGVRNLVRDLNHIYKINPALHQLDGKPEGFHWVDFQDDDQSVVSWVRRSEDKDKFLLLVSHFTPVVRQEYRIGVPEKGVYTERLNTDAGPYGGGDVRNEAGLVAEDIPVHDQPYSIALTLPPYATLVLERVPG